MGFSAVVRLTGRVGLFVSLYMVLTTWFAIYYYWELLLIKEKKKKKKRPRDVVVGGVRNGEKVGEFGFLAGGNMLVVVLLVT